MEQNNKKAWLYLLPAILFLGVFMVYPLVDVFIYSFEENYVSVSQTYTGVGLYNYEYVLKDPYFLQALKNTLLLVAITVPLSTGIDMVEATIDIALGNLPNIERKLHRASAIRFFNTPVGVITDISGLDDARKIEGVQEISIVKQVGDTVGDIGSSTDRVGFVIAQGETAENAVEACENAIKTLKITID